MVKKIIFDIPSGQTIEEEMSEAELQLRETDKVRLNAEYQEHLQAIEAKENAKVSGNQKLLDLGLTQAEATALTGYTPPVE